MTLWSAAAWRHGRASLLASRVPSPAGRASSSRRADARQSRELTEYAHWKSIREDEPPGELSAYNNPHNSSLSWYREMILADL